MPNRMANGITIEYEEYGAGEPLLLVMGLGGQLTAWPDGLVEQLAERFRVIAFDNRDAGLSSEVPGPMLTPREYLRSVVTRRPAEAGYTVADMAGDAVGLLDALGIERAHVVGVSMGGMIAQTMAVDHPGRVRSLVSIMSNTGDRRRGSHGRRPHGEAGPPPPADPGTTPSTSCWPSRSCWWAPTWTTRSCAGC